MSRSSAVGTPAGGVEVDRSRSGAASAGGPFKFLDYFTAEDSERFDGRDSAIKAVTAGILQGHTFVLYGRSGSGKTSLLLAGVFPELESRGYRPIYVRTLSDPEADLREALALDAGVSPDSTATIRELVAASSARQPLVLVLDQFEEFFIRFRGEPEVRQEFIETIGRVVADPTLDLRVLFSLRQDYLAELDDFREYVIDLFDHEYRLKTLTAFGARQAIARQLHAADVAYEPAFLVGVVNRLEEVSFDPTILQIICSEVFRHAHQRDPAKPRLTVQDLSSVGSLRHMFRGYLDTLSDRIPEDLELTAHATLDALVTKERTKRAVTVESIAGADFQADVEELEVVLDALVEARLVRREERGGECWYELIHERLVAVIVDWLVLNERFFGFKLARDLIENAGRGQVWRRQPETLLNPAQIEGLIGPYAEHLSLSSVDAEFILRSAVYRCEQLGEAARTVPYWTERFGAEPSRSILIEQLSGTGSADVRRSAVTAARWLPDLGLHDECARLALVDPDAGVQEAARESLALLGGGDQFSDLRSALQDRSTRKAAIATFATQYIQGARFPELGRRWRLRIWWAARRKVLREAAERVREGAKVGALRGAMGAIVWTYVVGLPLLLMFVWLEPSESAGFFELALAAGGALPMGLGIGALVGWRFNVAVIKSEALRPDMNPVRRLATNLFWLLFGLPAAYLGAFAIFFLLTDDWGSFLDLDEFVIALGYIVAVPLAFSATLGVLTHTVRKTVQGARSEAELWGWALAGACGASLLAPLVLYAINLVVGWGELFGLSVTESLVLAMVAGALLSFLVFTAGTSLGRVSTVAGDPSRAPVGRGRHRLLAAAAVGANVALFVVLFGFDTVRMPGFAPTLRLDARDASAVTAVDGRVGPGRPDADYVRLVPDGESPLTAATIVASGDAVFRFGTYRGGPIELTLLMARGFGAQWMSAEAAGGQSGRREYRIEARPEPIYGPQDRVPVTGEWTLRSIPIRFEAGAVEGVGTLEVATPPVEIGDAIEVLFFREYPHHDFGPSGDGRLSVAGAAETPVNASFVGRTTAVQIPRGDEPQDRRTFLVPVTDKDEVMRLQVHMSAGRGADPDSARIEIVAAVRVHSMLEEQFLEALGAAENAADFSVLTDGLAARVDDPDLLDSACLAGLGRGFARAAVEICERAAAMAPEQPSYAVHHVTALVEVGDLSAAAVAVEALMRRSTAQLSQDDLVRYADWASALRAGRRPSDLDVVPLPYEVSGVLDANDRLLEDKYLEELSVRLPTGPITIDLTGAFDTYLEVLSPEGVSTTNDDGGGGTDSRIALDLPQAGRWTIRVTSFTPRATGAYTLRVARRAP